jgi:hypothetical protein
MAARIGLVNGRQLFGLNRDYEQAGTTRIGPVGTLRALSQVEVSKDETSNQPAN